MKPYCTAILLFIALTCMQCSEEEVTPSISILEFANIEVGNYWVYEWYEIEPDGTESSYQNLRDTVSIIGDSTIAGKNVFIKAGTFLGNEQTTLLYDSANSLYLYPSGELLFTLDETVGFSLNHGPEGDPIAITSYALQEDRITVSVPAGAFECRNYQGTTESHELDYEYGTRTNDNFYSNGVGLVLNKTHFYSSPNNLEMRLVSYGKN